MEEIVILSAARTAIGKFNGTLKDVPAPELGATAIRAAVERAGVKPEDLQECVMGNVLSAGIGQNPARQAAMKAGLRTDMGSMVVNDVCGSGLMAVIVGANAIKAGEHEIVVAGGMESMNNAPYLLKRARFGYNIGDGMLVDHMVHDGLWDYFNQIHMGMTAEYIAERFHVNRADSDKMAYESHMKAHKATVSGKFKDEIVPVRVRSKKGRYRLRCGRGDQAGHLDRGALQAQIGLQGGRGRDRRQCLAAQRRSGCAGRELRPLRREEWAEASGAHRWLSYRGSRAEAYHGSAYPDNPGAAEEAQYEDRGHRSVRAQ